MNKTVKKLLLNLYFLKQLVNQEKYEKAKLLLENETGLELEELMENHNDKTLKESVSVFSMEVASLNEESFDSIAQSFTQFISNLYYAIVDLINNFETKENVINDLNILFRFPLFEATLLHFVQNELIEDLERFNNVVLSTYIHVSHIKYLSLIDDYDQLNNYIYNIGIDTVISSTIDIEETEVELLLSLNKENNDYIDPINNYFNSISNEAAVNNMSSIITSCEYVQEKLRTNIYIKNIV